MDPRDPTALENVTVDAVAARQTAASSGAKREPTATEKAREARLAEKEKRLAATGGRAPTKAEIEKAAEEQEYSERQKQLDKIGRYKNRFPQLKSRNKNLTIKSSLVELLDEVHYIEEQLGSDDAQKTVRPANLAFVAGMYGLEKSTAYWNPLNLKLQGLGQTVQVSITEFEPLIDEYCIKHGMDTGASVELRLAGMICLTVASVHAANTGQGKEFVDKMNGKTNQAADVSVEHSDL